MVEGAHQRQLEHLDQILLPLASSKRVVESTSAKSNVSVAAMALNDDPIAQADLGVSTSPKTQELLAERDHRALACGANADRERQDLSARETAAYQERAQEERDRESLILMLTTTRLH